LANPKHKDKLTSNLQTTVLQLAAQLVIMMDIPKHMENFVTAMQQVYQFPMAVDDK
jgi:hypothetical protein